MKLLPKLILVVVTVLILFQAPTDPDFGWHYRYGEYIVTHQQLLKTNIFSYTMPNYYWANSYWLSQVIFYLIAKTTSVVAISFVMATVLGLVSVLIFSKTPVTNVAKYASIFTFACLMTWYSVSVRPMIFSVIFLLFEMYVLLYNKRLKPLLLLVFVLWVNMHADFTLGLLVLGVYEIYVVVEKFKSHKLTLKFFGTEFFLYGILPVAATLVNPYGINLWTTLVKEANPLQFRTIGEWQPAWSTNLATAPQHLTYLFVASLLLASAVAGLKRFGWWHLAVSIIVAVAAMRSQYFMRILVVVTIFSLELVVSQAQELLTPKIDDTIRRFLKIFTPVFCFFLALVVITNTLEKLPYVLSEKAWAEKNKYPLAAVTFINKTKPAGKMFNPYNWGGYLIWKLPQYQTFIDGRMPSWSVKGDYILQDFFDVDDTPEKHADKVRKYFDNYAIRFVIDKPGSRLVHYLEGDNLGHWKEVYKDDIAVVLTKD